MVKRDNLNVWSDMRHPNKPTFLINTQQPRRLQTARGQYSAALSTPLASQGCWAPLFERLVRTFNAEDPPEGAVTFESRLH